MRGILEIYYANDDDVKNDSFVQMWIDEVRVKGYANADNAEIPDQIDSLDQLETTVTMVIFALSVGHSSETNPMWDIYGNPPNHPVWLSQPLPKKV